MRWNGVGAEKRATGEKRPSLLSGGGLMEGLEEKFVGLKCIADSKLRSSIPPLLLKHQISFTQAVWSRLEEAELSQGPA